MSVPTVAHDTAIGATGADRAPHSSRLRRVRRAAVAGLPAHGGSSAVTSPGGMGRVS